MNTIKSEINFKKIFSKFNYAELLLKFFSLIILLSLTHIIISYIESGFFKLNTSSDGNGDFSEAEHETDKLPNEENVPKNPINLSHVTNTDVFIEPTTDSSENANNEQRIELFPLLTKEMEYEGYALSQRNYEKGICEFYRVDLTENESLPKYLNMTRNGTRQRAVYVEMGFVFVYDNDGNGEILNNAGEKIMGDLKYKTLQLVYQRDRRGRPVFFDGENYTVYDAEQKAFVETDFDSVLNNRGLYFSYSRYFGYPLNSKLVRFYNSDIKKWGYRDLDTDEIIIDAVYDEAYNFNNGYAVAIKYEYRNKKRLYFLDEEGKVLNSDYFAPDYMGKDKLGFLYFDNGLTRALYRNYHWNSTVLEEIPYLCYPDGTIFKIPADYTLKAYSDGLILLEKEGKYGFMDSKGNWIIQPIYTYASPFNEGVAVIGFSDTQKALIDTQGNLITNFEFAHITDCSGGVIALFSYDDGWIIINKMQLTQ